MAFSPTGGACCRWVLPAAGLYWCRLLTCMHNTHFSVTEAGRETACPSSY